MNAEIARRETVLRIVAAAILAPPVLAAAWFGAPWFTLVVLLAVAVAGYEWRGLCGQISPDASLASLAGPAIVVLVYLFAGGLVALILLAVMTILAGFVWLAGREDWDWTAIGLIYLGLPSLALLALRDELAHGQAALLLLLVIVWTTDIAAWAVGRNLGGPRMVPAISPGKTWSGAAGGLLAAILATVVVGLLWGGVSTLKLAVLGGLVSVSAQCGDLAESWLKRHFGHKDSGVIIPGHGGVLDRVDSLLFAAPVMLALIVLETGDLP